MQKYLEENTKTSMLAGGTTLNKTMGYETN